MTATIAITIALISIAITVIGIIIEINNLKGMISHLLERHNSNFKMITDAHRKIHHIEMRLNKQEEKKKDE